PSELHRLVASAAEHEPAHLDVQVEAIHTPATRCTVVECVGWVTGFGEVRPNERRSKVEPLGVEVGCCQGFRPGEWFSTLTPRQQDRLCRVVRLLADAQVAVLRVTVDVTAPASYVGVAAPGIDAAARTVHLGSHRRVRSTLWQSYYRIH